jgi:hypothetical protein
VLTQSCYRSVTARYLAFLNKRHATARKRVGKAADIIDGSLETAEESARIQKRNEQKEVEEGTNPKLLNSRAFDDLTDTKNEEFIYVL